MTKPATPTVELMGNASTATENSQKSTQCRSPTRPPCAGQSPVARRALAIRLLFCTAVSSQPPRARPLSAGLPRPNVRANTRLCRSPTRPPFAGHSPVARRAWLSVCSYVNRTDIGEWKCRHSAGSRAQPVAGRSPRPCVAVTGGATNSPPTMFGQFAPWLLGAVSPASTARETARAVSRKIVHWRKFFSLFVLC